MNRSIIRGFAAAVFVAVLVGCDKKETASKQEDGTKPKQDENIVNLTKANLELVTIKTEPALKGGLEMTLKAASRVSDNLNKTAKVASTLEGRLIKLNFDLNDRVKTGDVLGLVQTPELPPNCLESRSNSRLRSTESLPNARAPLASSLGRKQKFTRSAIQRICG